MCPYRPPAPPPRNGISSGICVGNLTKTNPQPKPSLRLRIIFWAIFGLVHIFNKAHGVSVIAAHVRNREVVSAEVKVVGCSALVTVGCRRPVSVRCSHDIVAVSGVSSGQEHCTGGFHLGPLLCIILVVVPTGIVCSIDTRGRGNVRGMGIVVREEDYAVD